MTETWIPAGIKAKKCTCRPLLIDIPVALLETHIRRDKKQNKHRERIEVGEEGKEGGGFAGTTCCGISKSRSITDVDNTGSVEGGCVNGGQLLRCLCGVRVIFHGHDRYTLYPFTTSSSTSTSSKATTVTSGISIPASKAVVRRAGGCKSLMPPSLLVPKIYFEAITAGLLLQCCECDCWYHIDCLPREGLKGQATSATCHICQEINRNSDSSIHEYGGESESEGIHVASILECDSNDVMDVDVAVGLGNIAMKGKIKQTSVTMTHRSKRDVTCVVIPDESGGSECRHENDHNCVTGTSNSDHDRDSSSDKNTATAIVTRERYKAVHAPVPFSHKRLLASVNEDDEESKCGVKTSPPTTKKHKDVNFITLGDRVTASVGVSKVVQGTVTDIHDGHFRLHVKVLFYLFFKTIMLKFI